ncbi:DDE-type integrase/transposase/recombinase [Pigmentibacter sp. JX0631]|uniref:DDE-type integrase/transposase/recombinase n=1 Tax=Pigmentibacter sp. JX0631 TaxID=2976982 RepID=UPI002469063C|nr:DDE-type integrase/transposase/recombinase [Pigmentibacter sp. JX0631]WGL60836.1 DDE-type integrase/transposase/recombinase [Pigmentibacter sp. JX0631]
MNLFDEIYTQYPFCRSRRITAYLCQAKNIKINIKKVDRLMSLMVLQLIYLKKNLSILNFALKKYPYLLSGMDITEINQVWIMDIIYIRLRKSKIYLYAVIDWNSNYILSWKLTNKLKSSFFLDALEESLKLGKTKIFNTDYGSQITINEFTNRLLEESIQIIIDGRRCFLDNLFVQ